MSRKLFTSESVTEGHPDKICDQISDAVLDAMLAQDPSSRVACETAVTTGLCLVMGEVTTRCYVDIADIARSVINDIGFDKAEYGFDGNTCAVLTSLHGQSPDIALGVGYNNVSSFNYAFAKFAGMSPSQFRSRYAGRRAMGAARSTHPTSPR